MYLPELVFFMKKITYSLYKCKMNNCFEKNKDAKDQEKTNNCP